MSHRAGLEKITFTSAGTTLVGNLFLPGGPGGPGGRDGRDGRDGRPGPAAVVSGSWTTVKEQMAGCYARGLAEAGITALAFDFHGCGESGGDPRDLEEPDRKSADIAAAVDYLRGRPDVDPDRVGGLGVCAGAGYTAVSATRGAALRSLAMVAPWLHDAGLLAGLYGGAEQVAELRGRGEAAAARYRATGEVSYVPAVSLDDPRAAMVGDYAYYLDESRGAVPQWPNRFAEMGWLGWLGFDAIAAAPGVAVPTVLVHSRDAAIPAGAERFHAALPGAKALHWMPGSQFDFYDEERTVSTALDHVLAHFRQTL
ncbi:alpha/beta hydrolase [Kitasatospora sp. NBC_01287]|uniref:alpha/beta hydrolase n=1 Tax=Kitasatospora sp. NBC_01287 TaxID=2903573 RepID=UPI00225BF9F2|nr:alpha/beta fold hydrolase [Kitasatospora sp. NBC_01287]MCX4750234.1 alpha/beta hydrolase [Kitasatospora sp. NBC_01287]